jgi:hypothetical protein
MRRISRREFHHLATVGAISGAAAATMPLVEAAAARAQAQTAAPKPPTKILLTPEQEKKVQEAVAKRDEDVAALRSRTLPYTLEPAFVFQVHGAAGRRAGRR